MINLGKGAIPKLTKTTNTTDETLPQQQKMNRINQKLATVGAAVVAAVGISYWKINQNGNKIHEDMEDEAVEKEDGEKDTPLRVWISDIGSSGSGIKTVVENDKTDSVDGDKDKDAKNKNEEPCVTQ